jgi:hypothetical protein
MNATTPKPYRLPLRMPSCLLSGVLVALLLCALLPAMALGDGKIVPPRDYKGSLEEKAQEAIVIFHGSQTKGKAVEDLILKIRVQGSARKFAWVVPFPNEPTIAKEDPKLFSELFSYVQARTRRRTPSKGAKQAAGEARPTAKPKVEVLSRRVVGSYDTAVVREKQAGALNKWLKAEGFQSLDNAEDVIGFYRKKGYVFACIKVSDAELHKDKPVDSHPLRFTFKTGGRDGIYFPMKMTGLQRDRFDVNLYIFYNAWINDRLNKFGYIHRGFRLRHRDWDTRACKPNAGKAWSAPQLDVYLKDQARAIPTVAKLFQKLHPGARYYLTNIYASGLKPDEVRQWADDLWVFPYYVKRGFVPYDAREDGPASAAWAALSPRSDSSDTVARAKRTSAVSGGWSGVEP